MNVRSVVIEQFRRPRGFLGHLAGWVMVHRGSNRRRSQWTVELLDLHPGDRVLEIGCGPGLAFEACLESHPSITAVGLDHSALMIEQAARRNEAAVLAGRLHLVVGSLSFLPLFGQCFTKCLMVNVAQFIPDRAEMLYRVHAAMEADAVIAVTFQPRNPGARWEVGRTFAEDMAADLGAAGFEEAAIHHLELRPVPAFCVVARASDAAPAGDNIKADFQ